MRNTLSIRRTVLSGRVSAKSSARFTMRRASRVVASQADKKANPISNAMMCRCFLLIIS